MMKRTNVTTSNPDKTSSKNMMDGSGNQIEKVVSFTQGGIDSTNDSPVSTPRNKNNNNRTSPMKNNNNNNSNSKANSMMANPMMMNPMMCMVGAECDTSLDPSPEIPQNESSTNYDKMMMVNAERRRSSAMGGMLGVVSRGASRLSKVPSNVGMAMPSEQDAQASRMFQNMKQVVDFTAKLNVEAGSQPKLSLETLMESLGYLKRGRRSQNSDDDSETGSDASGDSNESSDTVAQRRRDLREDKDGKGDSFHFSFDNKSGADLMTTIGGGSSQSSSRRSLILNRFSSELAHRSWIENNPAFLSAAQLKARESGLVTKKNKNLLNDEVVPVHGLMAIAVIDISGYSSVATALTAQQSSAAAKKGSAHVLSKAVNAYFDVMQDTIGKYNGDVVNYAGDAMTVVWTCEYRKPLDSVMNAAACCFELQQRAGTKPIPGLQPLPGQTAAPTFGIHCAVTFGDIDSMVFKPPSEGVQNNQKAYHFLSGAPLLEMPTLLGESKRGEVVLSDCAKKVIAHYVIVTQRGEYPTTKEPMWVLNNLEDDHQDVIRDQPREPAPQRSSFLEKALVPNSVAVKLKQGFKTAHIAEMRLLCVLFVRKQTEEVTTETWFHEVSQILDECRCPIVQILNDDKGTHLIAAVGLYRSENNPASVGVYAARTLEERKTASVVGVAVGQTFCGITGSEYACRWDLTSGTVVRAARLMSYAASRHPDVTVVFDESIYQGTDDQSQLQELPEKTIVVKGSDKPVRIFTTSQDTVSATAGILNGKNASLNLHREHRENLVNNFINSKYQRALALVSGPTGVGKLVMTILALEEAKINFTSHLSTRNKSTLSLVRSIADFFSHHYDTELAKLAQDCKVNLVANRITQALSLMLTLIRRFISRGLVLCVVVRYVHLLDPASVDFIKSVVNSEPTEGSGRFLFILTSYPLWGTQSPQDLESTFSRPLKSNNRIKEGILRSSEDVISSIEKRAAPKSHQPQILPQPLETDHLTITENVIYNASGSSPPSRQHTETLFVARRSSANTSSRGDDPITGEPKTQSPVTPPKNQKESSNFVRSSINNASPILANYDNKNNKEQRQQLAEKVQTSIIHIKLSYIDDPEIFADAFQGIAFFKLRPLAAEVLLDVSGGCLNIIQPVQDFFRKRFLGLAATGGKVRHATNAYIIPRTIDGTIHIVSRGLDYFYREIDWLVVAPNVSARFAELYDALETQQQLLLRVIATLVRATGGANRPHVIATMTKLNPKLNREKLDFDIDNLIDFEILTIKRDQSTSSEFEELRFKVNPFADVVLSLFTPEQGNIFRRAAFRRGIEMYTKFDADQKDTARFVYLILFVARLARACEEALTYRKMMREAWELTMKIVDPVLNQNNNNNNNNNNHEHANIISDEEIEIATAFKEEIEEHIRTEHRVYPEFCTADIFKVEEDKNDEAEKKNENNSNNQLATVPDIRDRPGPNDLDFEAVPLMPPVMLFVSEFGHDQCPMALSSIAGELHKLVLHALNNWLDFTSSAAATTQPSLNHPPHNNSNNNNFTPTKKLHHDSHHNQDDIETNSTSTRQRTVGQFAPKSEREKFKVDISKLMNKINKFDDRCDKILKTNNRYTCDYEIIILEGQMAPPKPGIDEIYDTFKVPTSIEEERSLLEDIYAYPKDAEDGERKVSLFRAYHYKMILRRRCRIVEMVHSVTSQEKMFSAEMKGFGESQYTSPAVGCGMKRAYVRLARPNPVSTAEVSRSLMDLAVRGFKSDYKFISLQTIRDQVIRNHTATVDDFKAFLNLSCTLDDEDDRA